MAKERQSTSGTESTISIIAPGTRLIGECETDGSIRIEGIVEGTVRAGKAVVVGKDGVVQGDVFTQDAVIAGRVQGLLIAESRLEVQASSRIDGDVRARRMQLEEGAELNGTVKMGEVGAQETAPPPAPSAGDPAPAGSPGKGGATGAVEAPEETDEREAEASQ